MPDREKVIKGLECHQIDKDHRINCSDCPYHCDGFMNGLNDLHNDAIALLKDQEPIWNNVLNVWTCPNCGQMVSTNYCRDCGRKLKWE